MTTWRSLAAVGARLKIRSRRSRTTSGGAPSARRSPAILRPASQVPPCNRRASGSSCAKRPGVRAAAAPIGRAAPRSMRATRRPRDDPRQAASWPATGRAAQHAEIDEQPAVAVLGEPGQVIETADRDGASAPAPPPSSSTTIATACGTAPDRRRPASGARHTSPRFSPASVSRPGQIGASTSRIVASRSRAAQCAIHAPRPPDDRAVRRCARRRHRLRPPHAAPRQGSAAAPHAPPRRRADCPATPGTLSPAPRRRAATARPHRRAAACCGSAENRPAQKRVQAGDREPFGSAQHLSGRPARGTVQAAPAPASSSTLTVHRSMRSRAISVAVAAAQPPGQRAPAVDPARCEMPPAA